MWLAKIVPFPLERSAAGKSAARLNNRTALPLIGGTNDAAMVSTAVDVRGGHVSFNTTTSGPGVNGILLDMSG